MGWREEKIKRALRLQTESQKSRKEAGGGDVGLAGWVSGFWTLGSGLQPGGTKC